jgi:hypothetical protein
VEVRIGTFADLRLLYSFAFVPAATALDGGDALPPSLVVVGLVNCCFFFIGAILFTGLHFFNRTIKLSSLKKISRNISLENP